MPSENATLELALRDEPQAVMLSNHQLVVIANTDFVPKGLRGNVPACLACVARGRAMGIPDMVALNGIAIIEGKATLSAELMVAIVREHGHSITGDVTATGAVVRGKRRDNGDAMTAEFNLQMAEAAGLTNKANWKRHPDDMMWARAVSKLCRRLFADCFAGGTYAPDDMEPTGDEVIDEPTAERPPVLDVSEDEIIEGRFEEVSQAPGSVSSWADLKNLAESHGIPRDVVSMVWRETGAGKRADQATADDLAALWVAVQERTAQQVLA